MGARRLGWAVSGGNAAHDETALPGLTSLGELFASVRNALCDLIEIHRPRLLIWCAAEFVEHDHVWEAHKATRTIAELVAYDNDVAAQQADQRKARIAVLGRGDFGERGPYGMGLVADSGRRQAKEAVAAWCREQDYGGCGFEVGNALVLRRYCEIIGRKHERVHRSVAQAARIETPPSTAATA